MNKITRKSFLKVLAATMVGGAAASALTGAAAPVSIDETNGKVSRWVKNNLNPDGPLTIAKQGMFSSGGTVTAPVAGTYDATTNWLDTTRAGNTAHVDHANVLYQIPADSNGWPMVYLHGYGPVSYTHLDVYKRQEVNSASWNGVTHRCCAAIGSIRSNAPTRSTAANPAIMT